MTDKTKPCQQCKMSIPEGANVCFHCKRSQGRVSSKLESAAGVISIVSMILSIFLVTLSCFQFIEATKQRNAADLVVQSARDAQRQAAAAREDALKANEEAKVAKNEAELARDETRNAVELLRTNIKLLLEMERLTPKLVLESYDPVRVKRVRQKLEEFAVPNEKERKKWSGSLK
jgi:hypothetical protein